MSTPPRSPTPQHLMQLCSSLRAFFAFLQVCAPCSSAPCLSAPCSRHPKRGTAALQRSCYCPCLPPPRWLLLCGPSTLMATVVAALPSRCCPCPHLTMLAAAQPSQTMLPLPMHSLPNARRWASPWLPAHCCPPWAFASRPPCQAP